MRPARDAIESPPAAELQAVALAALAEACVLAFPVHLVLAQGAHAGPPEGPFTLGFLAVFVAGATTLRRFRGTANATAIAGAVAVLAVLAIGGADLNVLILRVLVAAVVAFRAASLGFRDWLDPLAAEIGWGALAMGAEAALGSGAGFAEWRIPLAIMVPLFFTASLGSRAVTIWHEPEADPADARHWSGRIRIGFAAYVACVLGLAAAALRGGIIEWLGSIVAPVASLILTVVLFALQVVLSPITWLTSRFQVDTNAWQRFLQTLRRGTQATPRLEPSHGAVWGSISRILGFLLFSLLVVGLYRALRRFRAPEVEASTRAVAAPIASAPIPEDRVPSGDPWRRRLPTDRVRRWYAEALLALERHELRKDPSLTPAEFAREVGLTLPELREHLDPLTRAYEDVRYGSLRVDDVTINELHEHHRALLASLRRPHRAPPP